MAFTIPGFLATQYINYKLESQNEITDPEAKLTNTSYTENLNERIQKYNEQGYDYDTELSSNEINVLKKKGSETPTIVFKGTSTIRDLKADIDITLGNESRNEDFKNAKEVLAKTTQKYKRQPNLYGHSLGSYKVEYLAKDDYTLQGTTFSTPFGKTSKAPPGIKRITNDTDPIYNPLTLISGRANIGKHVIAGHKRKK